MLRLKQLVCLEFMGAGTRCAGAARMPKVSTVLKNLKNGWVNHFFCVRSSITWLSLGIVDLSEREFFYIAGYLCLIETSRFSKNLHRRFLLELKNKVCIVTGASSGIGLAVARLLSEKGAYVVLVSRSKEKLERLTTEMPNSMAVPADMSKAFEIKRMVKEVVEHFDGVDVLVNNAGVGYDAFVERIDSDTFHYVFDLDLVGPVVAMQQVIPQMKRRGSGVIVNVSSAVALMTLPNNGPYASIKRALAVMSLTAREELKKDNISVGVAYPYITLTNFERNTIRDVPVPESEFEPHGPFPPDSAEHTAEKIVEGIEKEEAEIFTHEWLRQRTENR